jgi:hypothetical protein
VKTPRIDERPMYRVGHKDSVTVAGRSGRHPSMSLASSASMSTLMKPKKLMFSRWPGAMNDSSSSGTSRPWPRSSPMPMP